MIIVKADKFYGVGKREMNKQTVTIGGIAYDPHTGMRLEEQPKPHATVTKSHALHKKPQGRAHTLSRAHVRKPVKPSIALPPKVVDTMTRSPQIRKFATDIHVRPSKRLDAVAPKTDIAPTKHPVVEHAKAVHVAQHTPQHHSIVAAPAAPAPKPHHETPGKSSKEIKHHAIEKALHNAKPAKVKKHSVLKHSRFASVASGSLAIVLLAGYFTYINLPNISVRVAAAQAGIAATYPSYHPAGYSLKGPVSYSSGQVGMEFASNTSSEGFKLTQAKSTWDSSALLTNYVEQASHGDYSTYTNNGLTIYVYGNTAAWVNGGILHTISGDAPLSSDQVQKIAVSM